MVKIIRAAIAEPPCIGVFVGLELAVHNKIGDAIGPQNAQEAQLLTGGQTNKSAAAVFPPMSCGRTCGSSEGCSYSELALSTAAQDVAAGLYLLQREALTPFKFFLAAKLHDPVPGYFPPRFAAAATPLHSAIQVVY